MTKIAMVCGGTAGHINPALAIGSIGTTRSEVGSLHRAAGMDKG